MSHLNVHLYRDGFETPWGFRLQGGTDLKQPLIVQRVFSNSPAEGELQRGDVILSINSRDASQLTHKQAQDLIKHGGGQVQLAIRRPPPGTQVAPLSPPIVTQQPRAPKIQGVSPPYHQQHYPQRPTTMSMYHQPQVDPHPRSNYYYSSSPQNYSQSMHINVTPTNDRRRRSIHSQPPVTPTTPTPPWALNQGPPQRVSKLSQLGGGGGGFSFGTNYATLPRSRSSMAHHQPPRKSAPPEADLQDASGEHTDPDRLATGAVPRTCNLRNLGGGGFSFGTDFRPNSATLPRRNISRRQSQPPSMPSSGGTSYGHMPTKLTLNRYGGGGPQFGNDYSSYRPAASSGGQTPAQRYEPPKDRSMMLNRVQTSLDVITLSPRTPDAPQGGSPFYQQSQWEPPAPQQVYTPTSLLLEQQEQEQRRQQQLQQQQQQRDLEQQRQLQQQQYEQQQQFQQQQQHMQQQPQMVEQQRDPPEEGEEEEILPVWERRKMFMQPAGGVRTPRDKPAPKVPRPQPGNSSYTSFGLDFSKPQPKQSVAQWKPAQPAPQFNPAPAPVNVPVAHYSPGRPSGGPDPRPVRIINADRAAAPEWHPPEFAGEDNEPAWRSTLRSANNVRPWERDLSYAQDQSAVSKPGQSAVTPDGERDWSKSSVLQFIQSEGRRENKRVPPTAPKPQQYHSPPQAVQPQAYYDEIGASDF